MMNMNRYFIKSEQPNCKYCGKPLKEWNPFATEHEHIECTAKRISYELIELFKEDLNKNNYGSQIYK